MADIIPIRPWFAGDDGEQAFVDERVVKDLALRYRLLPGQVRGLIAKYGMDRRRLDAEADRLRHR